MMNLKMPKNLGMLLLAVWLILFGVLTAPFLKFSFAHSGDVRAVLGIEPGGMTASLPIQVSTDHRLARKRFDHGGRCTWGMRLGTCPCQAKRASGKPAAGL
jgi:hypothetical protein